jgi:hypothetical protein
MRKKINQDNKACVLLSYPYGTNTLAYSSGLAMTKKKNVLSNWHQSHNVDDEESPLELGNGFAKLVRGAVVVRTHCVTCVTRVRSGIETML